MKLVKYLPLVIVVALAACGEKTAPVGNDAATASPPASATAPAVVVPAAPEVATPAPAAPATATATAAPVASAADLAKGEQVYTSNCLSCHGAALMGAPKFADKTSWQPRIAKGMEVLYTNSLNGFNMMPAKGGNAALKDDEVKAAVDYMVSKAS